MTQRWHLFFFYSDDLYTINCDHRDNFKQLSYTLWECRFQLFDIQIG